jgi:hypothetical protein
MKSKALTHNLFMLALSVFILCAGKIAAQSTLYDNFEGNKSVRYGERSGVLDTVAKNPAPNSVNSSAKCALYVRNGSKKFDNIKMGLTKQIADVEKYATYLGIPPKFKMKVYTSAPPGTLIEILLGAQRGNNDYPAGTHSQYQAYTKTSNQWEELEFLFSQIPQGSETPVGKIDQLVLLFNPNSSNSDTYYFDDLTGPPLGDASKTGSITEPIKSEESTMMESVITTEPVTTATPTVQLKPKNNATDKKKPTAKNKDKKQNK